MDKLGFTHSFTHMLHTFCAQTLRIQTLLNLRQSRTDIGIQT